MFHLGTLILYICLALENNNDICIVKMYVNFEGQNLKIKNPFDFTIHLTYLPMLCRCKSELYQFQKMEPQVSKYKVISKCANDIRLYSYTCYKK